MDVSRVHLVLSLACAIAMPAFADDDDKVEGGKSGTKLKFWNLTGVELVELSLAPAGTDKFGADQAANEEGHVINNDERALLKDVDAGVYDVRLKDKAGRTCLVKGVTVRADGPYAFSLEADQLQDCKS